MMTPSPNTSYAQIHLWRKRLGHAQKVLHCGQVRMQANDKMIVTKLNRKYTKKQLWAREHGVDCDPYFHLFGGAYYYSVYQTWWNLCELPLQ